MVKKQLFIFCFLLMSALFLFSDEDHQRIGVEKKVSHRFTINGALGFSSDKLYGYDIYTFLPELSANYTLSDTWYINMSMPFKGIISMEKYNTKPVLFTYGDPSISTGYLTRLEDYKLRFALSYSYPLGIWNPYQVEELGISGGSGYHRTAFTASVSRILDPVILNTTLVYGIGLPREDRFGWSMTPGDISLSFTLIEVLNDEVGISFGIINDLYLPAIYSGSMDFEETSYNLSLVVSLLWHKGFFNSNVSVNKNINTITSSPGLRIEGGWVIEVDNE
ncbi:MAG: hypothetical protein L3J12_01650 [Spirochaetales bacterium]|nr:hypothetical protein [Spirochaetales bacterium]